MKKALVIIAAVLGFAVAAAAQPRAIGARIGYGAELSYQHSLGSNFIEADLGWNLGVGALDLGLSYDFAIAPVGPFNFYAGPSAQLWAGFGEASYIGLGVGAQVGLEYCFDFPLQLSLDWRPLFNILPATGFGWQSLGLGVRYLF